MSVNEASNPPERVIAVAQMLLGYAWLSEKTRADRRTRTSPGCAPNWRHAMPDWRVQTYQRHYVWTDCETRQERPLTPAQVDRILADPDSTIMLAKPRVVQVQDGFDVGIIMAAEPDERPAFDVLERPSFWDRNKGGWPIYLGALTWIVSLALGLPLV